MPMGAVTPWSSSSSGSLPLCPHGSRRTSAGTRQTPPELVVVVVVVPLLLLPFFASAPSSLAAVAAGDASPSDEHEEGSGRAQVVKKRSPDGAKAMPERRWPGGNCVIGVLVAFASMRVMRWLPCSPSRRGWRSAGGYFAAGVRAMAATPAPPSEASQVFSSGRRLGWGRHPACSRNKDLPMVKAPPPSSHLQSRFLATWEKSR
mmetsp:Transcript_21872/g.63635  ORF Transcript_21872/g.63635 Transcript_21872/m.63635 type:complete len:204 (-) Transcript_21872:452-1063(-)